MRDLFNFYGILPLPDEARIKRASLNSSGSPSGRQHFFVQKS
jgi:hypothetical protein